MRFFLVLGAIVFVGCGGDDGTVAAGDAARDTTLDTPADGSTVDTSPDTPGDTAVADSTVDSSGGSDTGVDSGSKDTGVTDTGTTKDTGGGCTTACDCSPGLGCVSGKCISGFVPVYCCEGATCPTGQQCQHGADGTMSKCP